MTAISPKDDRVDVWSATLNQQAEVTPMVLVQSVVEAGTNVTLTPNPGTGKLKVDVNIASGVPQATETNVGGGQIITQGEADAGVNDTDILTIKKLLALGGNAIASLRSLIGVGMSSVVHDSTLSGNGTAASPLTVKSLPNGIGSVGVTTGPTMGFTPPAGWQSCGAVYGGVGSGGNDSIYIIQKIS